MKRALVPGTFDPITNGHLDVIERTAGIFDEVVVGVAASAKKRPIFTLEERVALVQESTACLENVTAVGFDDLLVNFARQAGATVVVKGLRATTDFEYEFQMSAINFKLDGDVDTMFIMSSPDKMHLSSSIVRELMQFHGDISSMVPPFADRALKEKFSC